MFYYMNIKPTWKNVFQNNNNVSLDDYYNQLGDEFLGLYKTLKNNPEIEIRLSETQQQQFNRFFESLQTKYINLQPEEYIATIRRLGLIAFRYANVKTPRTKKIIKLNIKNFFKIELELKKIDFIN